MQTSKNQLTTARVCVCVWKVSVPKLTSAHSAEAVHTAEYMQLAYS